MRAVLLAAGLLVGATACDGGRPEKTTVPDEVIEAAQESAPSADAKSPPSIEQALLDDSPTTVLLNADGVLYEQSDVVAKFLSFSHRCSPKISMSMLDFLRARQLGINGLPSHIEVRSEQDGPYEFVVIREEILTWKGAPIPGAPGFVTHRYYYNPPIERFELVGSVPDDPAFDPRLINTDPLRFFATRWEPVCNAWVQLPEQRRARAAQRKAEAADVAKPVAPAIVQQDEGTQAGGSGLGAPPASSATGATLTEPGAEQ